jgi:hypothetical protein
LNENPEDYVAPKPEKKHKFPMKFKVFLRLAIGGRSYGDRLHIFRKYWCHLQKVYVDLEHVLPDRKTPEFFEAETNREIEKRQREGVDESFLKTHTRIIAAWRKASRTPQAKKAASERWLKENRKKLLAILQKRINDISHR